MTDILTELQPYADHVGYPEELPNFGPVARRALNEITRLRAQNARLKANNSPVGWGGDHLPGGEKIEP
jgi:hypothetical protein